MSRRLRFVLAALFASFALGATACGGPTAPVESCSVQNSGACMVTSVQNSGA